MELISILGLAASPFFIQCAVVLGLGISIIITGYLSVRLLSKVFASTESLKNKDNVEEDLESEESDVPPPDLVMPKRKPAIDSRLLLEGINGWFNNIDLFWYSKYLSLQHSKLFLVDQHYFKGARCLTINKDLHHYSINEAILSDLDINKTASIPKSIFAYPLYLSANHWVLVLVDTQKRTIEYYDSRQNYPDLYYKGKSGTNYINKEVIKQYFKKDLPYTKHYTNINAHFKKFAKDLTKQYPGKPYTFVRKFNTYVATNDDDCGPWTLYCLEQRLKNPDLNFDKLNPMPNMKVYRSTIAHNLVTMDDYCIHHGIKPLKSVVSLDKEVRKKSLKSR